MAIPVAILMAPGFSACASKNPPDYDHALDCWSALTLTTSTAQVAGKSSVGEVEAIGNARDDWMRLALSSGGRVGKSADDVIAAFGQRGSASSAQIRNLTSSTNASGVIEMLKKNNTLSLSCAAELKKY